MKILLVLLLVISQSVFADSNKMIVKKFVNAFNSKDVDSMLGFASDDMQWMSIAADNISIETSNREALKRAMQGYFQSMPSARSEIRQTNESGSFVYSLEEAFWTVKDIEKSQCSMAVYEFDEGKIKHVWYFPSHACSKQ